MNTRWWANGRGLRPTMTNRWCLRSTASTNLLSFCADFCFGNARKHRLSNTVTLGPVTAGQVAMQIIHSITMRYVAFKTDVALSRSLEMTYS